MHRKVSTYLRVSTRIFLSHEWARTEGRASQFTLMPCGVELFHADGADFRRTTCEAKFLCISVISVCNDFWHKYWIGAPKTRAKITIFQTPVFQLFISLLYRRTKGHNAPRPLRLCVRSFSHGTESRCPNLWGESNPRKTQKSLHVFSRICAYVFSH